MSCPLYTKPQSCALPPPLPYVIFSIELAWVILCPFFAEMILPKIWSFSQIVLALGACLKTASCAKQLLLILILILSIFGFVAQATFPLLEMNAFHGYSINDITHLG